MALEQLDQLKTSVQISYLTRIKLETLWVEIDPTHEIRTWDKFFNTLLSKVIQEDDETKTK